MCEKCFEQYEKCSDIMEECNRLLEENIRLRKQLEEANLRLKGILSSVKSVKEGFSGNCGEKYIRSEIYHKRY